VGSCLGFPANVGISPLLGWPAPSRLKLAQGPEALAPRDQPRRPERRGRRARGWFPAAATQVRGGWHATTVQDLGDHGSDVHGGPGHTCARERRGTGTADRLDLTGAIWSPHSVNKTLQIQGFDANFGATYNVFVTANGTKLGTFTESSAWQDGGIQNNLRVPPGPTTFTSFTNPGSITVTDSLGGSATIPVTVNPKYS
jgi:hypothetical protein